MIIPVVVVAAEEEVENMAVVVEVHIVVHHHRKVDEDTVVVDIDCLLVAAEYKVDSGNIGLPCCHEWRCSVDARSVEICKSAKL